MKAILVEMPIRPEIVTTLIESRLNYAGSDNMILHPLFNGTGLLKLTYIKFVSPTIPEISESVLLVSTVKEAVEIIAG